jgi:hypothetical protein
MGEGVDPTKMCQGLVDKVTRSKQLRSVTDPEILILFEDWLEELEEEVVTFLRQHPHSQAADMAKQLGLSQRGATFLLAKQQRETRNNNREE